MFGQQALKGQDIDYQAEEPGQDYLVSLWQQFPT